MSESLRRQELLRRPYICVVGQFPFIQRLTVLGICDDGIPASAADRTVFPSDVRPISRIDQLSTSSQNCRAVVYSKNLLAIAEVGSTQLLRPSVRIFDLDSGTHLVRLGGFSSSIWGLDSIISRGLNSSPILVAGDGDGHLYAFNGQLGHVLHSFTPSPNQTLIVRSIDGWMNQVFASGFLITRWSAVREYDLGKGGLLQEFKGMHGAVWGLDGCSFREMVFASCGTLGWRIWSHRTRETIAQIRLPDLCTSLRYVRDLQMVVTGVTGGKVSVFDVRFVRSSQSVVTFKAHHSGRLLDMTQIGSEIFASVSTSGSATIWNLDGKVLGVHMLSAGGVSGVSSVGMIDSGLGNKILEDEEERVKFLVEGMETGGLSIHIISLRNCSLIGWIWRSFLSVI